MRYLPLLPLLWFACVLGCGSGTVLAPDVTKLSIQIVMAEHQNTLSNPNSIAEVAARLRAIDLSGCPADFRSAFLPYIQAWERMALVEARANQLQSFENFAARMVESFVRGAVGDPFGTSAEVSQEFRELDQAYHIGIQQVFSTYHNVENVAARYGVY